jgi:hypothetical protein
MEIVGVENLGANELQNELQRGGKFVVYQYCISVVLVTFRRSSNIYFIRPGESAVGKGLPFTLLSLVMGWWGIPWGPIYTVGSMITNFGGGKDVTAEVVQAITQR